MGEWTGGQGDREETRKTVGRCKGAKVDTFKPQEPKMEITTEVKSLVYKAITLMRAR